MTLGERLEAVGGRPAGFDYMRLVLSTMVLAWHSVVTSYGPAMQDSAASGLARAPAALTMPLFFCLSGFAVTGSLERSRTLVGFMGLRILRIYPALLVAVLAATFVVGPLLTTYPLGAYFSDPVTWRYFAGVTGVVAYELPGVFLDNPNPVRVNGQLWTVPFDMFCYSLFAALAALGLVKRRRAFLVAALVIWAAAAAWFLARHGLSPDRRFQNVPGSFLIVFFLAGAAVYLYRDRLPWSGWLAAVAASASLALFCVPVWGDLFAAPGVAYLMAYLGLLNPRKHAVLKVADLSYGVFIYGYLIQQCLMTLGPWTHRWWVNLLLTFPIVWTVALLSWRYVEKPALRQRTLLFALEERWIGRRRRFVDAAARLGRLRPPARVGAPAER